MVESLPQKHETLVQTPMPSQKKWKERKTAVKAANTLSHENFQMASVATAPFLQIHKLFLANAHRLFS
jgi:hypothetical protein